MESLTSRVDLALHARQGFTESAVTVYGEACLLLVAPEINE